jgi:hypothetical protein
VLQANRLYEIAHDTLGSEVAEPASQSYQDRKVAEACTYPGCDRAPDDDCNECSHHRAASKERRIRYRVKQRREWLKKKLCLRCGGKRKQGRTWCAACLIKLDRLRTADRDKQRDKMPDRTTRESEADGYARTRYHGQSRRGQQPGWQLDDQDLDEAISLLQRTKQGLELARDAEAAGTPRIQRQEIKDAALALAAQASRFVDEVLDRNRFGQRAKSAKP